MLLIVNADDLGTSEAINSDIFALMRAGIVTSASVIANAPAFPQAAKEAIRFSNCSFGVQLNLTAFAPICRSSDLEPILDENGHLSPRLFMTPMTPELRSALLCELTDQVQRTLDAGIQVSHFGSYQHIHTLPKLFPVLKSLQRRFAVKKVRSTVNLLPFGSNMTAARSLKKRLFRFALSHVYSTRSPQGLGDFRDFHHVLRQGYLPRFPSLELMVHPGTTNSSYNDEVNLLRSDWRRLLPPSVSLVSYHAL